MTCATIGTPPPRTLGMYTNRRPSSSYKDIRNIRNHKCGSILGCFHIRPVVTCTISPTHLHHKHFFILSFVGSLRPSSHPSLGLLCILLIHLSVHRILWMDFELVTSTVKKIPRYTMEIASMEWMVFACHTPSQIWT